MGHSVNGRNLCGMIAGYMIIKCILNIFLNFGFTNILMLLVSAALGFGMIISFKYMNIVTAVFLAVMVVIHIKDNITNIGFNVHLIYLAEAAADIFCAFQLVVNKDIREYFNHS